MRGMVRDASGSEARLQTICRLTLEAHFPSFRDAAIEARFYPYIGLTHSIRRRGAGWLLRISDHCADAPAPVLEAIALMLGCKIMRRRPPEAAAALYRRFRSQSEIRERVSARRRARGRKRLASGEGKVHSLGEIFRELNRRYFNRQLEVAAVGWGLRRAWYRLGHYDPLHQTITVSPVLDTPKVPRSVLAYLVYHEMLHVLFDDVPGRGHRLHPQEFRRAESAFPDFREARQFLREFSGRRGRM